jgi:hypothetical protein
LAQSLHIDASLDRRVLKERFDLANVMVVSPEAPSLESSPASPELQAVASSAIPAPRARVRRTVVLIIVESPRRH